MVTVDPAQITLQPIDGDPQILKARILDDQLDAPIRRIFPLWLLQRTLRMRQLTLVAPSQWDDPREDPVAHCGMTRHANPDTGHEFRQTFMDRYLAAAWAQSWSFNPGSDTLLRAYSRVTLDAIEGRNTDPRNEGVTITSTPRKLMQIMANWAKETDRYHFVIGRVLYETEEHINGWIANIVQGEHGPRFFQTVQGRADSLLWKRDYFRHEDEIRLICVQRELTTATGKLRGFQFDPNATFTGISFDPRLREFERREREAVVRELGYEGPITEDRAYQGIILDIQMVGDWPDPA